MLLTSMDISIEQHLATLPGAVAVARLVCAMVAGGLIGLERESRGREAGFRTNILVCLGSAIAMVVSTLVAEVAVGGHAGVNVTSDPARIAYGVMAGIGFLGGGVIIRDEGRLRGLTTAAGLWCVAGIGLAAGLGLYSICGLAALLVLLTLWLFRRIEDLFPKSELRVLTIRRPWSDNCIDATVSYFTSAGFVIADLSFERSDDLASVTVQLRMSSHRNPHFREVERQLMRESSFELLASRRTN